MEICTQTIFVEVGEPLARAFELISFIIGSNAISAKASIGCNTIFHHRGVGCVVHSKTTIGNDCHIFSNVTIGSKWHSGVNDGSCPVIGNGVFIGAGAVLIGNIRIGDGAIIGANSVVLCDVPPMKMYTGVPAREIERGK